MLIPFSLQLCSKHFRFDKYVAICILDVQETSRRCRRKFRKHTYAHAHTRTRTHTHTHTHTHRILIYSFLQELFMNEQETDKSSYHFVCNEFKIRRFFFNLWLLCSSLYLPLCRTGRLVSRWHLKCYLELRWQ